MSKLYVFGFSANIHLGKNKIMTITSETCLSIFTDATNLRITVDEKERAGFYLYIQQGQFTLLYTQLWPRSHEGAIKDVQRILELILVAGERANDGQWKEKGKDQNKLFRPWHIPIIIEILRRRESAVGKTFFRIADERKKAS